MCRNLSTNPENERTRMLLITFGRNSTVHWMDVLLTSIGSWTCVAIGGELGWYTALVQFNFKEVSHSWLCSSVCWLDFKNIATPSCHTADSNGKKNHLCQRKTSVTFARTFRHMLINSFLALDSLYLVYKSRPHMPDSREQNVNVTKISCSLTHSELITNKVDPFERSEIGFSCRQMTALTFKNVLSIFQLSNDHLVCHARQWNTYQPKNSSSDNKWARGNWNRAAVSIKAKLSILVFSTWAW